MCDDLGRDGGRLPFSGEVGKGSLSVGQEESCTGIVIWVWEAQLKCEGC